MFGESLQLFFEGEDLWLLTEVVGTSVNRRSYAGNVVALPAHNPEVSMANKGFDEFHVAGAQALP